MRSLVRYNFPCFLIRFENPDSSPSNLSRGERLPRRSNTTFTNPIGRIGRNLLFVPVPKFQEDAVNFLEEKWSGGSERGVYVSANQFPFAEANSICRLPLLWTGEGNRFSEYRGSIDSVRGRRWYRNTYPIETILRLRPTRMEEIRDHWHASS